MGFKDLRSFLAKLEEEGQLIRYTDPIELSPDVSDITRVISRIGHYGPAVMFNNIKGYKGQKMVAGVHGSFANNALLFGHSKDLHLQKLIEELGKSWDNAPNGKVDWVRNAPSQEVSIEGDDINLYELLPLYRINPLDGGFYFPKACVVTRELFNPDNFEVQNVGMYRVQVQGKNTVGMSMSPMHDIGEHYGQAEALGKPLPIAICLGADPLLSFMASSPLKYTDSEYVFAGGIGGFTYELTKAIGSNLDVPANAEFILEGEILPFERYPEGPFGEFPGSYSGVDNCCRVVIHRVTHRKDPIYETLYLGGRSNTESDTLTALNACALLYKQLKTEFPQVKAVNATYQHGMTTIISTAQRSPGFAKTIAMRLASTPHGTDYCRNIIMVDSDVDPFNLTEVMWALSTRVRGHEDVIIIPGVPRVPLIPADTDPPLGRKLIIDATTPVAPDKFRYSKFVSPYKVSTDWSAIIQKMQDDLQK